MLEKSYAGLITYSNRATFNAQGSISFNSNFNDFGTGFGFPSNPFTRGDVTYTSTENLIFGTGTFYSPVQNLMGNNWWTPVTGTVQSSSTTYNMFGFDLGVMWRIDPVTVQISTNLGSYTYSGLNITPATVGLDFLGFITTLSNEYITGFSVSTLGSGSAAGMTNVAVGHVQAVPVPSSFVLVGIGVACISLSSAVRRLKFKAVA